MAEITTMKLITLEKLALYHENITNYIDAADAKSIKTVAIDGNVLKFYRVEEPVGETAPAYEITLPETDISNLLAKLEGATAGHVVSVAEDGQTITDSGVAVADLALKSEVEAVDDKVDALEPRVKTVEDKVAVLEGDETTEGSVKKAVKDAKDALEAQIGNTENLETTDKDNLVDAINEVRNAVSVGGTAAAITIDTTTTTEGMAKSYTIKQGENVVGTIDIPKDLVVESGEVVTLADGEVEGQAAGTYIKLVLANSGDVLYVNVGTLVDIYKAKADATQVQIAIDSTTREISAIIVAGSIGTTELADGAVTTVKIANGNVTKEKLSTAVQESLDKADAAATKEALDAEIKRATKAEEQALTDSKAYTDAEVLKDRNRLDELEVDAHAHDNQDELDKVTEGDVAKWNAMEENAAADATEKASNAKAEAIEYVDNLNATMDTRVSELESVKYVEATENEVLGLFNKAE